MVEETTTQSPITVPPASPPLPAVSGEEAVAKIEQATKDIEDVKTIEKDYTKQPEKYVLTVKVKKWLFWPVVAAAVSVFQGEKQIDAASTDSHGTVPFTLSPGEYLVKYGGKNVPISIKAHSTLKL
jgi:hypothetical protein